jgi:chromosomal replication initiator protein
LSFSRFVPTPANRSALLALQQLAEGWCVDRARQAPNPVFLHGPAGTGKTHLLTALVQVVSQRSPHSVVTVLSAADLNVAWQTATPTPADQLAAAGDCDLLVLEDLQHLRPRGQGGNWESLVQLVDQLLAHQRQLILSANVGPARLTGLPVRLLSRLAGGLVVALEPLDAASRLAILVDKAQRRQLAVGREVLTWVAEHLNGGVRQLEGALGQLETLARLQPGPLEVGTVARQFQEQAEASRPTVERIVQRVGSYFQVEPRHLQSRRRYPRMVLPRQVSMYLARQLTTLSLDQIGQSFGGRDHSTVLHACRKIAAAVQRDALLCGAVRQLRADLG